MTTKKRAALKVKEEIEPSIEAPRGAAEALRRIEEPHLKSRAALSRDLVQEEVARRITARWNHDLRLVSQKHAEKLQKSLEESQRGLAIAVDFVRAQALISDQDLKAREIVLPHVEIPAFPKLALPDFDKVVFEASTKKARAGALRIADCGWATADWMAPGYVAGFARSPYKEIDAYFVERYLGGATFKGRLKFTADELLASPQLKMWKPLLRQTFECLQAEKYIISVPALISVIEGFASKSLINALNHPRSRVRSNKGSENTKWRMKQAIDGLFWSSAILLVNHMFADVRYNRAGSSFENRHGISEDLSQIKWNRVDAAKLVNALATLHWLFKEES